MFDVVTSYYGFVSLDVSMDICCFYYPSKYIGVDSLMAVYLL